MDPRPWIALNAVPGVGNVFYKRLLKTFGSPENVFKASEDELMRAEGARAAAVKAIKMFSAWDEADAEAARAEKNGVLVVTQNDPRYPENLREAHDPPPYLYVRGTLFPEDKISVAIVGARLSTPYGRQMTKKIAGDLASKGITVVSGGARGIDTEAHKGALAAGGRTIAVLGCGIDVVYPGENAALFRQIAEGGAVVTEYPFKTPPEPHNFPPRNRIISGISLGVVVVEASEDSGSLITASYSLDQGREVYAVPGSVGSPMSKGTNSLIKKGAKLVEDSSDVMLDLFPSLKGYLKDASQAPAFELEPDEKALFDLITLEPIHIDVLAEKAKQNVSQALTMLLNMELKGAVRQVTGMRFVREV